jgi:hypothetical protein
MSPISICRNWDLFDFVVSCLLSLVLHLLHELSYPPVGVRRIRDRLHANLHHGALFHRSSSLVRSALNQTVKAEQRVMTAQLAECELI